MSAIVLRGDAAHLPLPDASVDLIVTSPPYFSLRRYTDGGKPYDGQVGAECTPWEYLDALLTCTREWVRVLKPGGSIFVVLGDKYSTYTGANRGNGRSLDGHRGIAKVPHGGPVNAPEVYGVPHKSLMGLPWRYALRCIDELGLILRAEIIWAKPSAMPESVTDRVTRSHEQVFHFTRNGRYFAAVDEIRQPLAAPARKAGASAFGARDASLPRSATGRYEGQDPLGAKPGSVWEIAPSPLSVPAGLGVSHFAAFPLELCRRIILGWSPAAICLECGEGRRAVASSVRTFDGQPRYDLPAWADPAAPRRTPGGAGHRRFGTERRHLGYVCACTPYTDHPGTGEPSGPYGRHAAAVDAGTYENVGAGWGGRGGLADRPRVGPWREYHLDSWNPPPTRPALAVDPFGGTGTTALVADVLGRTGITIDRSADYCRLARWRTTDPGERARALGVPKPPPVPDGQTSLFDAEEAAG